MYIVNTSSLNRPDGRRRKSLYVAGKMCRDKEEIWWDCGRTTSPRNGLISLITGNSVASSWSADWPPRLKAFSNISKWCWPSLVKEIEFHRHCSPNAIRLHLEQIWPNIQGSAGNGSGRCCPCQVLFTFSTGILRLLLMESCHSKHGVNILASISGGRCLEGARTMWSFSMCDAYRARLFCSRKISASRLWHSISVSFTRLRTCIRCDSGRILLVVPIPSLMMTDSSCIMGMFRTWHRSKIYLVGPWWWCVDESCLIFLKNT